MTIRHTCTVTIKYSIIGQKKVSYNSKCNKDYGLINEERFIHRPLFTNWGGGGGSLVFAFDLAFLDGGC